VSGDLDSVVGYTGHITHAPSGLILAWRRAYDSEMGRWISEDPIGLDAGINMYAYVLDDPIDATDPTGLDMYKCIRQSNGLVLWWTNHVYFCDPDTGRNCGKGSQSGSGGFTNIPHGGPCQMPPPAGVTCVLIPGTSDPNVRNGLLACCKGLGNTPDWSGFFPITNDCHSYLEQCLKNFGLSAPGWMPRVGCRSCTNWVAGCPPGTVSFKDGCRPK
jgi:RHS repeat-associated protein